MDRSTLSVWTRAATLDAPMPRRSAARIARTTVGHALTMSCPVVPYSSGLPSLHDPSDGLALITRLGGLATHAVLVSPRLSHLYTTWSSIPPPPLTGTPR